MHKAFKYRIYPNKSQKVLLSKTFGCIRVIWNANVESFNSYDKDSNPKPKIIIKSDLIIDKPWLNEISAAAIQQKIRDFRDMKVSLFVLNVLLLNMIRKTNWWWFLERGTVSSRKNGLLKKKRSILVKMVF